MEKAYSTERQLYSSAASFSVKAGSILNTDTTINLPKEKKENGEVSEAAAQTVGKVIKHRQTLGYVLERSHLRVPFTGRRLLSKTSERVSDVFVFQFPNPSNFEPLRAGSSLLSKKM